VVARDARAFFDVVSPSFLQPVCAQVLLSPLSPQRAALAFFEEWSRLITIKRLFPLFSTDSRSLFFLVRGPRFFFHPRTSLLRGFFPPFLM